MSKTCLLVEAVQHARHPGAAELPADPVHQEDLVYSGILGQGRVVELLRTADGYAYGLRIAFDNGMNGELLITGVPIKH